MTTRLDRLFLLLDTGSTPVIRRSAAEQLGEVQKLHPHELNNLLSKVHGYLGSGSWETRIAAGQAVEAIVKNVPQWKPAGTVAKKEEHEDGSSNAGRLGFAHFDVGKVLVHGASLLGSEGAEYDTDDETLGLDQKERLSRQRQLLNKRLGLDVAANLGFASDDLFKDEDLVLRNRTMADQMKPQKAVVDLVRQQIQMRNAEMGMSSRERNRAKRKAKLLARQASTDQKPNGENSDSEPSSKKRKTNSVIVEQPSTSQDAKIMLDNVPDNTLNMEEMDDWPFDGFCELLLNDLFNPAWEKRHGAATGLREVLKQHAEGAGKTLDTRADEMELANQQWIEDVALRLICVLALDRFGDFVSDEVVAPVRETCAQTLGVLLRGMDKQGVMGVVRVLLQLLCQMQWEVRHGGLLGMKYLLAVRQDLTNELLPLVLPYIFRSLQDYDDDVRAVAAASLLPVANLLAELQPAEISIIVNCLWDTLLDLDDLTSSTNSIMELLASLLANPKAKACESLSSSLSELVPRLWPFLRHNISSVRKCALQMLITVLNNNSAQHPASVWLTPILQDALRHVYQRSLLEHNPEILDLVYKTWQSLLHCAPLDYLVAAAGPWLGIWLCLMMQPTTIPFDPNLLVEAKHKQKDPVPGKQRPLQDTGPQEQHKDYIGGFESLNESASVRDACVIRSRIMGGRLLGLLAFYITQPVPNYPAGLETPYDSLAKLLLFHLESKAALQRLAVGLLVMEWAQVRQECKCAPSVKEKLLICLNDAIYYDEIAVTFTRMQTDCKDFIASLKHCGVDMDSIIQPGSVLTFEQALALPTSIYDSIKSTLSPKKQQNFDERRKQLVALVTNAKEEQQIHALRVQACLAKSLVLLQSLPEKLNPVVRPLMEAIKKEENVQLQTLAAKGISLLLQQCVARQPSPNSKVIKNLCAFLCCDGQFTPQIGQAPPGTSTSEICCDKYSGIITLNAQSKPAEKVGRANCGRKPLNAAVADVPKEALAQTSSEQNQQSLLVQRRGAELALTTIATNCGADLPSKLPFLWDAMMQNLTNFTNDNSSDKDETVGDSSAQELVNSLQVLQITGPALHLDLQAQLLDKLQCLLVCMAHPYTAVRHMAARCMAMLARVHTLDTMNYTIEHILPALGASHSVSRQQGGIETLSTMVDVLGADIIPYIVLLVVPVLGCMSDQDEATRLMATHCFATLIKLMPLEAGITDPPAMKSSLIERKEKERKFLEQLLDSSKLEDYKMPVPVKAELRKYQQDGLNWLAFLNKYSLHGILCDDMGLGKTLQSICILAGDHYLRKQRYQETRDADCVPLQSIVVCPPTLTGHWVYEIEKFVDRKYLNPLHYTGPPSERQRLRGRAKKHNLIVASYDIVRNDIDFFGGIKWNYCILDEGHIIKNGKTKISKAVKQLCCKHRLILSGTPIQNNVLELWSLFDFLMPGFLGTEKQFGVRYGKPILQSRDAKSSSREQEAGALAMEGLHRQVLPFLLRRLKEDVLQDLPPKIIQDYICDLSPLQVQLYEDFARSRAKKSVESEVLEADGEADKKASVHGHTHVFQALQYLRKVCNHPALVMTSQHPEYDRVTQQLRQQNSSLHDIQHASKLLALKQLLTDCGIGLPQQSGVSELPVVNQHRVLLFCQLKSMLDIVEKDLFRSHMPSVTYLRLDGNVPAGNRHSIVNRFNNDPSIDVLLLTTHVGGLGLNLTGADTVVFVEHDWNPMKDLQAMDRAHRIGQKKVVNVYRLVTRGTLEEKIMGLQKFKLTIANTVINQDNSGLQSMGTDQLLDLFSLDAGQKEAELSKNNKQAEGKESMKSVLENLEELWDTKQYEEEYNLDSFMQSLQ